MAIAWQEYDGKRTFVRAMLSRDNGDSWETPMEIATSPTAADYPFILSNGKSLFLSWYAEDGGYHLYPMTQGTTS